MGSYVHLLFKSKVSFSRKNRISISYGSYNHRRYSRPWIGRITAWPVGDKPEIEWGSYLGDKGGGECEVQANPGDIIRSGQKDGRGNGSSNDWYVVEPSGELRQIDAAEARKLYKPANPAIDLSVVSDADLLAEIARRSLRVA